MTDPTKQPDVPAWCAHQVVIFEGQFDSHIKTGEDYEVRTLASIFEMEPSAKAKGAAPAFIPSSYHEHDAREHAVQRDRGEFVALCGDIDSGDHALATIKSRVEEFVGDGAWLIYSSAHARPGDMRWRIILPFEHSLRFDDWHDCQMAFFDFMEAGGIKMDHALARAAQPVYLPNVPEHHAKSNTRLRSDDAQPLYYERGTTGTAAPGLHKTNSVLCAGVSAIRRQRAAEDRERERIRRASEKRRANWPQASGASIIDDFNASNSVAAMLEIYGYRLSPRGAQDWRSPHQTSETYATRIIGEKWVSLSASDAAAGLGARCKAGCYGDAYDLYVHYEHAGDHQTAFGAIRAEERPGPDGSPSRDDFRSSRHADDPGHQETPDWALDGELGVDDLSQPHAGKQPPEIEPVDLWARYEEPPLPRGLLPVLIEAFAIKQSEVMGTDPAGLAMAALTVCGAAIPDSIAVQVKHNDRGWRENGRLWTAMVGPPSRKKTPIFKVAIAPLRRLDNRLMDQYLAEINAYERLDKDDKKTAPRPKQRRLLISDATIEAAQEVLQDSPDGVLSEQDELSGWFGAMDKYTPGKGGQADRAFWLKAYNGGTYNLNRITRGAKQIRNLSVALLGGIQPEPVRKLAAETIDDGLLQRLLPVVLRPSSVGQDVPDDGLVERYDNLVVQLHALRPPHGSISYEPTPLRFSGAALAIREQLEREHLELVSALECISPKLASHFGKYDGLFARLCLIWHCIETVDRDALPVEICEDTADRVARFMAEFVRPSAIAFYAGLLGMSAGHEEIMALAAFVVGKRLNEIVARDAQRSGQTFRHVTADQFRILCEKLEAFGWVERAEPKPKSSTPRWMVNRRVHTAFADRAEKELERRAAARQALRNALRG